MPNKKRIENEREARRQARLARELVVTAVERGLQLVLESWPAERRDRFWRAGYREGAALAEALESWVASGAVGVDDAADV